MIKIGILGYGNLGRGVESAVSQNEDMELVAIITRRQPEEVSKYTKCKRVYNIVDMENGSLKEEIDVLINCTGSVMDLPKLTPELAKNFNVVDSFDNHTEIFCHFQNVDLMARKNSNVALISCGWDPGLFSLNRLYSESTMPIGKGYTFWGKGVSQGHSDAIRQIEGVVDGKQYTIPIEEAVEKVKNGFMGDFEDREQHCRECYITINSLADAGEIEKQIKEMPNYFKGYDTTVNFISYEELIEKHWDMPHGGTIIRNGVMGDDGEYKQRIEYKLTLESNPFFTGSVLVAYARAVYRMSKRGEVGCKTVFDIIPRDLSPLTRETLIKTML